MVRVSTDFEPSVLASRLNSCSRKSRRRPTGSRWPSTRRISATWLSRRSSSSSTSSFCSHSTSSCSSRPGSYGGSGCVRSASRVSSFARWPARIAGHQRAHLGRALRDAIDALEHGSDQLGAFALARGDEVVEHLVEQRQGLGMQCRPDRRHRDCSTPGNCSSSMNCVCNAREAGVQIARERRQPLAAARRRAAAIRRLPAPRRRSARSTLPRETRVATRSRSAGSSARSSSGRRTPSSRKRWLTARSSQPSVPQAVLRSPEAKAVMLRIMGACCGSGGAVCASRGW